MQYIYPKNLTAKPTLWLWHLRDMTFIAVGALLSVFALSQTGIYIPAVMTAGYAFLSIRFDGESVMDCIRYASAFFFTKQYYEWRPT